MKPIYRYNIYTTFIYLHLNKTDLSIWLIESASMYQVTTENSLIYPFIPLGKYMMTLTQCANLNPVLIIKFCKSNWSLWSGHILCIVPSNIHLSVTSKYQTISKLLTNIEYHFFYLFPIQNISRIKKWANTWINS